MRLALLGGAAGTALFSCAVIVAGALRVDYSHVAGFISELGATATPHAALMNYAGFVPAGMLFAAFGAGLATALARDRAAVAASVLVIVFGIGVSASGIISCDPGCPQAAGSPENLLHNRIGPASFIALIVAVGILAVRFRRHPRWRALSRYSLLTSALAIVFLLALIGSLEARAYTGLWQRLLLSTLLLWCTVVGIRAFRT
jgi:hypothetical protein